MPQGISMLILYSLFESFLQSKYGLIISINILYTFSQLNQILDHTLRALKLNYHLSVSCSLLLKTL